MCAWMYCFHIRNKQNTREEKACTHKNKDREETIIKSQKDAYLPRPHEIVLYVLFFIVTLKNLEK